MRKRERGVYLLHLVYLRDSLGQNSRMKRPPTFLSCGIHIPISQLPIFTALAFDLFRPPYADEILS